MERWKVVLDDCDCGFHYGSVCANSSHPQHLDYEKDGELPPCEKKHCPIRLSVAEEGEPYTIVTYDDEGKATFTNPK
ncbi:MAG: hypothetical protein ACTSPB_00435 [Candidatus Thorarchaeota archaeon]